MLYILGSQGSGGPVIKRGGQDIGTFPLRAIVG